MQTPPARTNTKRNRPPLIMELNRMESRRRLDRIGKDRTMSKSPEIRSFSKISGDHNLGNCNKCDCLKWRPMDKFESVCECSHRRHRHSGDNKDMEFNHIVLKKNITQVKYVVITRRTLIQEVRKIYIELQEMDKKDADSDESPDFLQNLHRAYITFRIWLVRYIVGTKWFYNFFFALILISTGKITIEGIFPEGSTVKDVFVVSEIVFIVLFIVEIVLKLLALGISFFGDGWNVFDFVIVLGGFVSIAFPNVDNLVPLRALRVFRPLRTISRFPALTIMVNALLYSFGNMGNVVALLAFLLVSFGILGLYLWNGKLHQRCYDNYSHMRLPGPENCVRRSSWSSTGYKCPINYTCLANSTNPAGGLIGFDTFGVSLLTIFVIATREDWSPIMYALEDSWWHVWPFFVGVIVLTSFFSMTLVVGVMLDEISGASEQLSLQIQKTIMTVKKKRLKEVESRLTAIRRSSAFGNIRTSLSRSRGTKKNENKTSGGERVTRALSLKRGRKRDSDLNKPVALKERVNLPPRKSTSQMQVMEQKKERERKKKMELIHFDKFMTQNDSPKLRPHLSPGTKKQVEREETLQNILVKQKSFVYGDQKAHQKMRDERKLESRFNSIMQTNKTLVLIKELCVKSEDAVNEQREYFSKSRFFHQVFIHIETWQFKGFIEGMIILNTLLLATEYHGMSDNFFYVQEIINYIFIAIFFLEMILKLIAYGPRRYIKDPINVFDAILVTLGILDVLLAGLIAVGNKRFVAFRSLRIIRTFRAFRLFENWTNIQVLLRTIQHSFTRIGSISLLMLLLLLVFGITGVQLFAKLDVHRSRYKNIWWSTITIFQLFTGDEWIFIMAEAYEYKGWLGAIFILVVYVVGGFFGINMFIAIILVGFEEGDREVEKMKFEKEVHDKAITCLKTGQEFIAKHVMITVFKGWEQSKRHSWCIEEIQERQRTHPEGKALNFFDEENEIRQWIFDIVNHPRFERIMFIIVLGSCITLALEGPDVDDVVKNNVMILNWTWAVIFTIEFILKIIAYGLYKGRNSYLADPWDRFDASLVLFSWMSLLSSTSWLVALRALRSFRVICRLPRVKVVINSLIRAIPGIVTVLLFSLLLFFVFGIIFVNFFKGLFFFCDCDVSIRKDRCRTYDKKQCEEFGKWGKTQVHFDNIFNAMMILIEMATFTGWGEIMYQATDSTTLDKGQIVNNKPWVPALFFVFEVVCGFFLLNLFVGVIVHNFNKLKKEYDGSAFLTEAQQDKRLVTRLIKATTPKLNPLPPKQMLRRFCYNIASSKYFEKSITMIILLNAFTLTFFRYRIKNDEYGNLRIFGWVFMVCFSLEVILKIAAYGISQYFAVRWNIFDFVVTVVSILGEYYGYAVFSLARVFRLIGQLKRLKNFFDTFIDTIPLMGNIAILLLTVMYVYTIIGIRLFSQIELDGENLSRHANFHSFSRTMLTLFRVVTGDDWHQLRWGIVSGMAVSHGTIQIFMSNLYFISFLLIGSYVMLDLYTAVVLENFTTRGSCKEDVLLDLIQDWTTQWSEVDNKTHGVLSVPDFLTVMKRAPSPFGFGKKSTPTEILCYFRFNQMKCHKRIDPYSKDRKNQVWCVDYKNVITHLFSFVGMDLLINKQLREKETKKNDDIDHEKYSTVEYWYAASMVQNWYKLKKKNEEYYLRCWFAVWHIQLAWRMNRARFHMNKNN